MKREKLKVCDVLVIAAFFSKEKSILTKKVCLGTAYCIISKQDAKQEPLISFQIRIPENLLNIYCSFN